MDSSAARLLRGFLEPCLLSLLAEHADYGLSLAQRLAVAGLAWTLSPLDAGPGAGRGAYKTVAPAIVLGWVLSMMTARITTRAATAPASGRPGTAPAAARRP